MDEDRLDALEKRIDQAKQEQKEPQESDALSKISTKNDGARVGGQFLSYVIAGGLFGYGLDRWLGTLPWFMMGMFIMGFVLGVHHANKAMNRKD